jgi:hypothetical protein
VLWSEALSNQLEYKYLAHLMDKEKYFKTVRSTRFICPRLIFCRADGEGHANHVQRIHHRRAVPDAVGLHHREAREP